MVAKDAADTIEAALRSVQFCSEIIVVLDDDSSDESETIARRLGTRVEIRPWRGYGPSKQEAVTLATGRWVFSLDADEVVSPELAHSIVGAVSRDDLRYAAYAVRRRTRYLGRWMRHGDWGRDRVVRLFRRDAARFTDDQIHESVVAAGEKPLLEGLLWHEGDQSVESYLARLNRYTTLAAESLHARGHRASWLSLSVRPAFKFLQAYILRAGFLDGWQGLVLAWFSSVYVFTKYAKLHRLSRGTE
jgi:glycosyltransferase involved in cell wall biosynthesis